RLRLAFAGVSRRLADEQRDVMTARGEKIGQIRAEPARGEVREPAHVVQRLERRPGGDDAVHAAKLTAKNAKNTQKFSRSSALMFADSEPFNLSVLKISVYQR